MPKLFTDSYPDSVRMLLSEVCHLDDQLDPLKESPPSVVNKEVAPEPTDHYGYKKPDSPFRWPKPLWKKDT